MNAVGIDVSKGKSMIAVMQPLGVAAASPFETLLNRQHSAICKHKTQLINNLISLIDQSFPNTNEFFDSPPRLSDGHVKWADFALILS